MSIQEQPAETTGDVAPTNEEFHFEHKLFSVAGCVFRKSGAGVCIYMPLGTAMVAVPVEKIVKTFDIPEDSNDAYLLKRVSGALKYVPQVRPGDSIPSEIIDGRASWMVDAKYLIAAKSRVSLQLVAWLSGGHIDNLDMHEFIVLAEKSETKTKVQEAFSSIAERLGYGAERREEIVELVDRFACELSYIEALRDQLNKLRQILATLKALGSAYRRDRNLVETTTRCSSLLAKPIQKVFDRFTEFDANIGEILNTLQRFDQQVCYIREVRDDLRECYLFWQGFMALWELVRPTPGPDAERALQESYRFAARNFSAGVAWAGSN